MKKYLVFTIMAILTILPLQNIQAAEISAPVDSLVQGDTSTVYYYATNGNRYVFPNVKTYDSWFTNFSQILKVSAAELAAMPLKGNITYRPGVKLVKAQTDPKVYAVDQGGKLRWIETETIAIALYGENWSDNVDDIPDAFFTNYQITEKISSVDEYSPATLISSVDTINADKKITVSGSPIKSDTDIGGIAKVEEPTTDTPAPSVPPPSTDTTGPVISAVLVTTSQIKATISWTTDELSDSKIEYSFLDSLATTSESSEASNDADTTSHALEITGLTSGATYYYKITSTDTNGNASSSEEQSFTTQVPQFVKFWGESGGSESKFRQPEDIAINQDDNSIFVIDQLNYRVQKFDSDGAYVTQFGAKGINNREFIIPKGIAVGSEGNVYVSDKSENKIQIFESGGAYADSWGKGGSGESQFSFAAAVATDKNDNVYVIDKNNRLQKFDSLGNFITEWNVTGTGLAIDSNNNIFILDKNSTSIKKYDASLNLVTTWGSLGSADGQFDGVEIGIAVDSNNNVYVVDIYNDRIQIFTNDGRFITKFGSGGTGQGQFDTPAGIALDSENNIYVTDFGNNRVLKFGQSN